jgi:sulfate adenylyltransferase subunit 1 (EFTu-like GTPase family)
VETLANALLSIADIARVGVKGAAAVGRGYLSDDQTLGSFIMIDETTNDSVAAGNDRLISR